MIFVSNANVLAARTVLAKSTCAIMSWLPLETGSEPVSGALLTRSEFPKRWIPLRTGGPVETFKYSVCDIPLCRSNRFGHSSSPVIACLSAEYIRDEAKTMWVRLHVMDPENGVDSV